MNNLDAASWVRILVGLATFGLIAAVWIMLVWSWWLKRRRLATAIEGRLNLDSGRSSEFRVLRLWHDGREATTLVPTAAARSLWQWMADQRTAAGFTLPLQTILLGLLGACALVAALTVAASGNVLASLVSVSAVLLVFWTWLKHKAARRQAIFDAQLVDALDLAARSLRAGHPLGGAIQLIAQEIPDPVGTAFADVIKQEDLGVSHEESMRRISARTHQEDLRLVATAITIQIHSGGNLAEMMDRLAWVLRDRLRLNRRVRVLTAQTRFSKNVLLALPFVIIVAFNLISPAYLRPLFTEPTGHVMLAIAGAGIVLGGWVMGRMAKLNY